MATKSNKPEDMLLRVIRVAELLAKGADTTADNGEKGHPTPVTDPEQKHRRSIFL